MAVNASSSAPPASQSQAPGAPPIKRRLRNYLLDPRFQFKYTSYVVIVTLVVASVLMSMGMMMLSPVLISLPFKLMLFVLVDGWALVMGSLASSFYR